SAEADKKFETAYHTCLKQNPEHPLINQIRLRLAAYRVLESRLDQAEEFINQVLKSKAAGLERAQANDLLGKILIRKSKFHQAEKVFDSILSEKLSYDPSFLISVRKSLLTCCCNLKKYQKADQLLPFILSGSPSFNQSQLLHQVADSIRDHSPARAEMVYRKALSMLEPTTGHTVALQRLFRQLSTLSFERGKASQARRFVNRELQLLTTHESTFNDAARCYMDVASICTQYGFVDECRLACDHALACLKTSKMNDMSKAKLLREIGLNFRWLGDVEKFKATMDGARAIFDKHNSTLELAEIIYQQGEYLTQRYEFDSAKLSFEEARLKCKDLPSQDSSELKKAILLGLASTFLMTGMFSEAERISSDPSLKTLNKAQRERWLNLRVCIYQTQFKLKQAESLWQEMAPGPQKTHNAAISRMEEGQFQKACGLFDQALKEFKKETPGDSFWEVNSKKSVCLHLQNRDLEAEKLMEKVLSKSSSTQHHLSHYLLLANLKECMGKQDEAKLLLEKAHKVKLGSGNLLYLRRVHLPFFAQLLRRAKRAIEANRLMAFSKSFG
ncbi:MAG: hypothetical protein K2Z81_15590, partial [Cyanobacteria bacterium]|nr:hypothetical protein [Cyanobacteriota bacterium]